MAPEPVIVILLLLFMGYTSYRGLNQFGFAAKYEFSTLAILSRKEYYRLVSSAFIHVDWWHFGFNAFAFYTFGKQIELGVGIFPLLLLFFGSTLGGNLLALRVYRGQPYRSVGASGGVCGIIFASVFLAPDSSVIMFPIFIPLPAWIYALLFIGVTLYAIQRGQDNMGHFAHLGGSLVGLVITAVMFPSAVGQHPVLVAILFGVPVAYLWNLFKAKPVSMSSKTMSIRSPKAVRKFKEEQHVKAEAELDRILEKISSSGIQSLSPKEKKQLKQASDKRKR